MGVLFLSVFNEIYDTINTSKKRQKTNLLNLEIFFVKHLTNRKTYDKVISINRKRLLTANQKNIQESLTRKESDGEECKKYI